MTLLCADIGNSHTVLGLLREGDVLDHWRVATDERRTSDEWAVLIRGLLADSTVADGLAAGGTEDQPATDYGFMYQRQLTDPDGHVLEFGFFDPVAAGQGPEAFANQQA